MKSYKLYVDLSYTKEVQAESLADAFLMAEEAVLDKRIHSLIAG